MPRLATLVSSINRSFAAVVAVSLVAAVGAAVGAPATVRNLDPQRPVRATDIWPINVPGGASIRATESGTPTAEQLLARLTAFHSALRYEEALAVADELVAVADGHPLAHYNRACILARLRRVDEALDALDEAVAQGWRSLEYVAVDPDLAQLRSEAGYREVVDRMLGERCAERVEPVARRQDDGAARLRALSDTVPELLERYRVPGAVVAVVHDGRLAGIRAFGAVDRGGRVPMAVETSFRVRGPGHLITLITASRLHEAAKLDLPDLLVATDTMLPRERRLYTGRRGPGVPIRRRAADDRGADVATLGALRSQRLAAWPARADTENVRQLLRVAVAAAGADSFASVCRSNVLQPLGMSSTRLGDEDELRVVCAGHTGLGTVIPAERQPNVPESTDTNARDLARLMLALMRSAQESPVLEPRSVDRLLGAAEVDLRRLGFALHADRTDFGVRVQVADVDAGVGCLLRWYPDRGDGIVVLFNGDAGNEMALRVAHAVLGGI